MRALYPLAFAAFIAACAPRHAAFSLAATDASNGDFASTQYYDSEGCTGNNVSPRLIWTEPPAGTQSLAVTIFDPDAKTDHGGWWHWLVSDLPSDTRELKAGAGSGLPAGAIQYPSDFGAAAYGGPCPPVGETHTYVITLYALKVPQLQMPAGSSDAQVRAKLDANAIATAKTTLKAGR